MKQFLTPWLICPAHNETQTALMLNHSGLQHDDDDILEADLVCPQCQAVYTIRQGIADLAPAITPRPAAQDKYELNTVVGAYLWSQFGDLHPEDDAMRAETVKPSNAYAQWGNLFSYEGSPFLDVGCAVGRLVFEAASQGNVAIGVDLSRAFIEAARMIARTGRIDTRLTVEGELTRPFSLELPERFRVNHVEFIIADALALPFRSDLFGGLASLNILDKVPLPLRHLEELSRVGRHKGCELVVSDPYSWSCDVTARKAWLGGTDEGAFSGRGVDNVAALLEGRDGIIRPAFQVLPQANVHWTIRNHPRHAEQITSLPLYATR